MGIFDRIKAEITPGTVIHRTITHNEWTVHEVRKLKTKSGEFALIYRIPGSHKPEGHKKNIKESEWNKAYNQLMTAGCFSRSWFGANMEKCSKAGCNFNAIGGAFSVMGIARSAGINKGLYLKTT